MVELAQRQRFYSAVFEEMATLLGPEFRPPKVGQRGQQTFKSGAFGAYWIWFAGDGLRVAVYVDSRGGDAETNAAIISGLQDVMPELLEAASEDVRIDIDPLRRAQWLGFVRETPDLEDPFDFRAAATWAAARAIDLIEILDRRLRNTSVQPAVLPNNAAKVSAQEHEAVQGDEWDVLRWEIGRALQAMRQGWLSVSSPATAHEVEPGRWSGARVVQVALRDDAWVAECSGNHFLIPPYDLSDVEHAALLALGWQRAGTAEPGRDPNLNQWKAYRIGAAEDIAELLVATARDVLDLAYSDLVYETGTGDGRVFALPYLRIPMSSTSALRRTVTSPEAAERLEMSIVKFREADAAIFDQERDHIVRFEDDSEVIIRLSGGADPMARVMCLVRTDVEESAAVLTSVNRLNCEIDMAKLLINKGALVAAADLPVLGLNDRSLGAVVRQVSGLARVASEEVPSTPIRSSSDPRRRSRAGYL